MATSGQSSFNITRNEIIRQAAMIVGAMRDGQSLGAATTQNFDIALNAMVKRWQAKGLHVWTLSEATLWPAAGQTEYVLGPGSTDHCSEEYETTTTTADEAAGEVTISVSDTTDMTVGDHIGVQLDDGTLHWSTIDSKAADTVTIDDALPDSAATDNAVFFYTDNLVRPIKIPQGGARLFEYVSGYETPIQVIARLDYRNLVNKQNSGRVNQLFYDPQLTNGKLHLYQNPNNELELVRFTFWRPIMDFTVAGDNPDLPAEWIDTLIYNLAVVRAPIYSMPMEKFTQIKTLAAEFLDDVSGFDRENESVEFGVDMSEYP